MNLQTAPKNNPFPLFEHWLNQAKETDPIYYCGMNVATVDANGHPSTRVVLLKEYSEQGFVFYTNYLSRKGQELATNPNICANFWWKEFQRQIRIDGVVEKVSEEQSDRYFFSRPQGSQLAAIASQQSQPIESIEALEKRYQQTVEAHQTQPIQRPKHWGGYRIIPKQIEFWQGLEYRLHHRLRYVKSDGQWMTEYLQP
jgi:pyridoxamine 5'-phosphate oxidase